MFFSEEDCLRCKGERPYTDLYLTSDFVSVLLPIGLNDYTDSRSPYISYLGSKTSESVSIIQPWEREINIPLNKRAAKLRNAIN